MAQEFEKDVLPQRYFEDDYLEMFRGLLPRGIIWGFEIFIVEEIIQDVISASEEWQDTNDSLDVIQDVVSALGEADSSLLGRLLSVFAAELERLEKRAWELLAETDPGVSTELLEDWERVLALPEDPNIETNIENRQRAAHTKLWGENVTATFQYYIDYAARLGFVVTVEENPALYATRVLGVARMGRERFSGTRGGNSILLITIISASPSSNLEQLQKTFDRIKQAHATIIWVV